MLEQDSDLVAGLLDDPPRLLVDPSPWLIVFCVGREHDLRAVEYAIEFGGTPQDVTITTTGPADAEGLVGLVRDLVSDPRFRPGMLILEDCTAIDASKVTSSDLRAKADTYIALSEQIGPSKLAIIVPSPASFGFARMWDFFLGNRTEMESRVFYSQADGLAWLESERVARLAPAS